MPKPDKPSHHPILWVHILGEDRIKHFTVRELILILAGNARSRMK